MKDNLGFATVFLILVLFTLGVVAISQPKKAPPRPDDATFRTIDCDCEFYRGKTVRVPLDGSQPGDEPGTIVFRRRSDLPPIVVLSGAAGPKDGDTHATGVCGDRVNGAVRVTGCVYSK